MALMMMVDRVGANIGLMTLRPRWVLHTHAPEKEGRRRRRRRKGRRWWRRRRRIRWKDPPWEARPVDTFIHENELYAASWPPPLTLSQPLHYIGQYPALMCSSHTDCTTDQGLYNHSFIKSENPPQRIRHWYFHLTGETFQKTKTDKYIAGKHKQ